MQDSDLATSNFFLHLCDALTPGIVNWEIVATGATEEEKEQNAKYVLSVARKMGCGVFLLWEDVVEVKPKMLMTVRIWLHFARSFVSFLFLS